MWPRLAQRLAGSGEGKLGPASVPALPGCRGRTWGARSGPRPPRRGSAALGEGAPCALTRGPSLPPPDFRGKKRPSGRLPVLRAPLGESPGGRSPSYAGGPAHRLPAGATPPRLASGGVSLRGRACCTCRFQLQGIAPSPPSKLGHPGAFSLCPVAGSPGLPALAPPASTLTPHPPPPGATGLAPEEMLVLLAGGGGLLLWAPGVVSRAVPRLRPSPGLNPQPIGAAKWGEGGGPLCAGPAPGTLLARRDAQSSAGLGLVGRENEVSRGGVSK